MGISTEETGISNNERKFLLQSLEEELRLDGRGFNDGRAMEIALGPKHGQSEVTVGGTRVSASIDAQIVRPSSSNSSEGILRFQINMSPLVTSSTEFPEDTEIILSRVLERGLRWSEAVDLEGLCIVAGEKVWELKVNLTVMDYDGNMFDAACTAAVCSLLHFKRPDVAVQGVDVIVYSEDEKEPIPLVLHHIPICTTFAVINSIPILDPSYMESIVSTASLSCIVTKFGEVCALSKPGGAPLPIEKLQYCLQLAFERAKTITDQITSSVAAQ